jgi:hypothetical protein
MVTIFFVVTVVCMEKTYSMKLLRSMTGTQPRLFAESLGHGAPEDFFVGQRSVSFAGWTEAMIARS